MLCVTSLVIHISIYPLLVYGPIPRLYTLSLTCASTRIEAYSDGVFLEVVLVFGMCLSTASELRKFVLEGCLPG